MRSEHEKCSQCGFDGEVYRDDELIAQLRGLGPRWRATVADAGDDLGRRPAPRVWSALEYAAHTRDVVAVHVFGVEQALTVAEPVFPEFPASAADDAALRYGTEPPETVVAELEHQTTRLADMAAGAGAGAWQRGLTVGANRSTVRRLLEHVVHDAVHHLDDVERGIVQLRAL